MDELLEGMKMGLYIVGGIGLFFFVFVFTFVKEGTAKAIKKFGQYSRMVYSYVDHFVSDDETVTPQQNEGRSMFGGLKFVGIRFVHSVDRRDFNWIAWEQAEKDGKIEDRPVPKEVKQMDYILLQDDIYYALLDKAECRDMIPLNVSLLLRVRIINPKKALFRVQNWHETMINLVKPAARLWVGDRTYEDLKTSPDEEADILEKFFKHLSTIRGQLVEDYGVKLISIGIGTVDPASSLAKEFIEASTQEYLAKQEKKQITTLADAETERIDKVYAKIKEHGEEGMKIRALESIDKAGSKEGNWVLNIGNLMKDIFGGN